MKFLELSNKKGGESFAFRGGKIGQGMETDLKTDYTLVQGLNSNGIFKHLKILRQALASCKWMNVYPVSGTIGKEVI